MIKELLNFSVSQDLFNKRDELLLAFSGGKDSVCLFHLLLSSQTKFAIAHCNFKLRGKESDEDLKFAKQLAKKHKVKAYTKSFKTEAYAAKHKISIQEAARDLRYNWFEEIRKKNNYAFIATAHHKNDNAETVLFNLTKGSGLKGLHGILPKRDKIIRPLLFANRNQIEQYINEHQLDFREDSSNATDKYSRNAIRQNVIPQLEKINSEAIEAINKTTEIVREAEALNAFAMQQLEKKWVKIVGSEKYITIPLLKKSTFGKSFLYHFLSPYGFNSAQVDDIFKAMQNEKLSSQFLTKSYRIIKARKQLIVSPINNNDAAVALINKGERLAQLGLTQLKIKAYKKEKYSLDPNVKICGVDANQLEYPLTLRYWKKGDYLYPLGMNNKKKKVSDLFSDKKLNQLEKERIPILLSGEKIVWVVGLRMDERFKVKTQTKSVAQFRICNLGKTQ